MHKLVEFIAPKGRADWVVKYLVLWSLINTVNLGVEVTLNGGIAIALWRQLLVTTLVASPFIVLALSLIGYLNGLQKKLAELAATDMLTGLANRRAFYARAEAEQMRRGGVALVMDVDHFKHINDSFGHDVGDRCLVALADLLRSETRATDVVGRIGGEEFAVLLVDAPVDIARRIGERLATGVRFRLDPGEGDIRVTTSVGAAALPQGADIDKLISLADQMMYDAKRAGRGRLVVWQGETVSTPENEAEVGAPPVTRLTSNRSTSIAGT